MDSINDLVFAGKCEVVVINGCRSFVAHPCDMSEAKTYLSGVYTDSDRPSQLKTDRIADLNGQFVLLRYDPVARTLSIATDRFGLLPFYSVQGTGCLYLSRSISDFAERGIIGDGIDFAALSDILAFNVPLDQRTLWRGVSGFAGGSEVVVNLDTLEQKTRKLWNPVNLLRNARVSFASVKDRLVELFQEGVEQIIAGRNRVAVTLSGGADSRCLLAAALRARCKPITYTTGVPGSRADAYARRMADLCGVPHYSHLLDGEFLRQFPSLLRQATLLMEGMSFSSEVEALWLRNHVMPDGVILHGAFAELFKIGKMHNFPYDAEIARLSGAAVSEKLWKRFSTRYAFRCKGFCAGYSEQIGEQARRHLEEKVSRYQADLDTSGVLQMLYMDEFLGKVAKYSHLIWSQRIPLFFPFAYPSLINIILRVRTEDKIANHFVAYLLRKINRTLAVFPDSNTGAPIGASFLHRELIHVFDWAMKRLFGSKSRSDHQDFADWLSCMEPGIETVFAELQSKSGIFDMEQIKRLIGRCRAGDDLSARTLQFLWALGIWKTEAGLLPVS